MASNYTPTNVTSGFGAEVQINKNFADLKLALDDALNRVEVLTDNAMKIPLDMGGFTVNNLPEAVQNTEAVRFGQLNALGIQNVVTAVPYATGINIDTDTISFARIILTGAATINFSGSDERDGQPLLISLEQDGTGSRIVTWESRVRFSTDMGNVDLSTIGGSLDYILLRYNLADNKWDALALNRGF
jgi:hypothetical protein